MPDSAPVSSAKRGAEERTGVHSWLPYYAGYSSAFVSDVMDRFELGSESLVLDPMNGSGTTTMVARRKGVPAIGVDANPAMTAVARAKDPSFADPDRAEEAAQSVVGSITSAALEEVDFPPEAEKWFSSEVYTALKGVEDGITRAALESVKLDQRTVKTAQKVTSSPVELTWADLMKAALVLTARSSSSARTSKNPTWVKPGEIPLLTAEDVARDFVATARRMATDLVAEFGGHAPRSSTVIVDGNAKDLPGAGIADAIVTSPPYLTRIDYAVSTAPELVFLGYDSKEKFRSIRTEIMGSTCIVGGDYTPMEEWGESCNRLLSEVGGHTSKASATYYLKQFVQYFRDAWAILEASVGLLNADGQAAFVVQDSWYKDVHVPLGDIYVEMARNLGAEATLLQSEEVRVHMGLVNTRARAYDKGDLHEHVVWIRKGS